MRRGRRGKIGPTRQDSDLISGAEYKKVPLTRLVKQAKDEKCLLFFGTICLFFGSLAGLVIPRFMGDLIDSLNVSKEIGSKRLRDTAIQLGVLAFVSGLFNFFRSSLFTLAGESVVARMRRRLFTSITRQEIGFFDTTRTGELVSRLSSDTSVIKNAITVNISMLLRQLVSLTGGLGFMFFLSWKLTLIMFCIIPVSAIAFFFYGKFFTKLSMELQDALAEASTVATECIGNIRTVRAFAVENQQRKHYDEKVDFTYKTAKCMAWGYGSFVTIWTYISMAITIAILYYGGTLVLEGEMSIGTLTSFFFYTLMVTGAFAGAMNLAGDFMKASGASSRIFGIIDRVPEVPSEPQGRKPENIQGHVVFKDVIFHYPSRPDIDILKNFNFELQPGKITALVGMSGGGKTTVVSLIERFYDVSSGEILIDDVPLKDIDPCYLRKQIGFVPQEPVLFACSIRDNITFGLTEGQWKEEEYTLASKQANAYDFIQKFPKKDMTKVGERGIRLSGGQKQRIAIARAIMMKPKILLLDEATSALDSESEHLVQEALDRLMKGRTTLIIAHRLSTVKDANVVVVIVNGEIVEQGSHDELLKRNSGVYAKLVHRQLQDKSKIVIQSKDEIKLNLDSKQEIEENQQNISEEEKVSLI